MEMSLLYAIQNLRCSFLDILMTAASAIGNGGAVWIAVTLLMLLIKKYRRCGVALAVALIFCLIFGNGIIKNFVARSRPCWENNEIELIIAVPRDYSFPSGHTFSSVAAAICITYFHKKEGLLSILLAVLIAFSRLYLFVHYPTDILGGAILGTAAALTGIFVSKRIFDNKSVKEK